MTTLERYAITIATSADRPKKAHTQSKYLDNHEDACRAIAQPTPRKTMGDPGKGHRADQEAFRKFRPIREKAEEIVRKDGGKVDVVAAQLAIIAKANARRETTDNIGRAV